MVTSGTKEDEQRATLTVEEAAERLGIHYNSAWKAIHAGEIPSIRIGRRLLVPRAPFERMLAGGEVGRDG